MAQLQSTNVTGTLCVNGVAVGGGKDFKYCCKTSTGTWTPSSDLVSGDGIVNAISVAGGGAGGTVYLHQPSGGSATGLAYGGGGGAGEVNLAWYPITSTSGCSITIGSGGAASNNCCVGGNGGNTVNFGKTFYGGGAGGSICYQVNQPGNAQCIGPNYGGPGGGRGRSGGCFGCGGSSSFVNVSDCNICTNCANSSTGKITFHNMISNAGGPGLSTFNFGAGGFSANSNNASTLTGPSVSRCGGGGNGGSTINLPLGPGVVCVCKGSNGGNGIVVLNWYE